VSQDRTVNAANEITGLTGSWADPAYDAAGNMKFGPKPVDETTGQHYVYDAWNRLVEISHDDGDGVYEPGTDDTLTAQYWYDGSNRRIEKIVTGMSDVHYYYNHDWQLLEDSSLSGSILLSVNQYVWSPSYIDAPIVHFHDGNADGDCNPVNDPGDSIRWYTTDANYNVTTSITFDHTSTVTEHYAYNAYGKATTYDTAWSNPTSPTSDGPLYSGYFFDAESALYQVRNRMYHSTLATFISRDPIGYDSDELNLYAYTYDNPIDASDPFGLKKKIKPGDPGWPPVPPSTPDGKCTIMSCEQNVNIGEGGKQPVFQHTFILIYIPGTGWVYYRGGPEHDNPPWGNLVCKSGPFIPATPASPASPGTPNKPAVPNTPVKPAAPVSPDYPLPGNPKKLKCNTMVVDCKSISTLNKCFQEVCNRINGGKLPYDPAPGSGTLLPGGNCNTVTSSLLQMCTSVNLKDALSPPKPFRPAPGRGQLVPPKCVRKNFPPELLPE
jgi:RHS repeat-associated protein